MKGTPVSRRAVLKGIGATAAFSGLGLFGLLTRISLAESNASFSLPDLPYAYSALEPVIDEMTMRIHHGKHHNGYVTKLNQAIESNREQKGKSLEQLFSIISTLPTSIRNNGGGHYNHTLFWSIMSPPSENKTPGEKTSEGIRSAFKSFEDFQERFTSAALSRFGSGWAWLIVRDDGSLTVTSTANQDNPLMDTEKERGYPLLGIDVWEHAYYLKYKNMRADYVKAWWKVVDWEKVEKRLIERPAVL